MPVPFKSNFTVCDEINGESHCVELFFNSDMRLLNISEPYVSVEGTIPVVHPDGYMVEAVQMSEMTDEQIKALTHNGEPGVDALSVRPDSEAWHLNHATTNKDGIEKLNGEKIDSGCSSCEKRRQAMEKAKAEAEASEQGSSKRSLLGRLAKGVPGLLKSELGIDQAEPALVDKRKSICLNCPEGIYNFGVCDEERGGCGCFLASKVTIEGESCPKGHW